MNDNRDEQGQRPELRSSSAPTTSSEWGELFELLRFVMAYCKQRLQVLGTMEEAELQTKTVNRQAGMERVMLLSVLLKVVDFSVTLIGPSRAPNKNPGRAPVDIMDKMLQKDMEAFFKALR